jgi:DNA-binding NarL/FixJ family response regulator
VVARGEALLSPSITRTLIGEFVSRPPDRATVPGLTNEEIAAHMGISPFTAKTHISRAMTKLGRGTGRNSWCSLMSRGW